MVEGNNDNAVGRLVDALRDYLRNTEANRDDQLLIRLTLIGTDAGGPLRSIAEEQFDEFLRTRLPDPHQDAKPIKRFEPKLLPLTFTQITAGIGLQYDAITEADVDGSGDGTWTVPAGVSATTPLLLIVTGGGAGGSQLGGGGQAGETKFYVVDGYATGDDVDVHIGLGGAGGTAGDGSDGEATAFDTTYTADGGEHAVGAAGGRQVAGGGHGHNATFELASIDFVGETYANNRWGGNGGASFWGGGGAGGTCGATASNGEDGITPGSGGGGAAYVPGAGSLGDGGAGAAGVIYVFRVGPV
jgi:hypothetical protein